MTARHLFLAIAIGAGLLSAVLYYGVTRRAEIVVAARDIDIPRPLATGDVELRALSADLVPADAAVRIDDVLGLVPRAPLLRGQILLARGLGSDLTGLRSGSSLAPSQRAVAIPVSAVNAVGGALVPGSRVDVIAVPVLGRAPAGRTVELLVSAAVVLDVRGESGAAYLGQEGKSAIGGDRIGSVVIAVPVADEMRFADRIATSTFVLALATGR